MSNAYSIDLRERAVAYVHEGNNRSDTCKVFKISMATLDRWLQRQRVKGDVSPYPRSRYRSKIDDNALRVHVTTFSDATLEDIAEVFGVYPSTIYYACKRLGITRKKNHPISGKERRRARKMAGGNQGN